MSPVPASELEKVLREVEKPVRYIGNEWNSVVRDGPEIDCRVILAYPDIYEIGMSHLGFRILYSLLNKKEGVAAERAFAPWPDCEESLRRHELPLYSLETKRPLADFDLLGFSMQYEMTATNVLLMLDLAGIPLRAVDRDDGCPLVLGGGPVVMNPEPFADFFDLIVIGDGEELFPELIDRYRELRDGGADRDTIVHELGRVPGVYAPRFYRLRTDDRTGLEIVDGSDTHPFPVKRRILMDLGRHPFPEDVIVPFCEVVHSRVAVEIMRGCNVGCRFCQAGYIYRPERARSADQVVETAIASSRRTGFDEVSLTSLNTGEYPEVESVVTRLMDEFESSTTGMSLPSLRASSLTGGLLEEISRVRKSGLTIAPEGGTQRMRDVISKNITEEDIDGAATAAYGHGWDLIKLYFMIGQPTEREEDVVGIAETARRVLGIGRQFRGGRARVNLGVSSFIPKPFTPFQWQPMERADSLHRKQALILERLGKTRVKFGRHDVGTSVVESALSRADRRVADAIEHVYRDGGRFDGWTECFSLDRWRAGFAAAGLDLEEYAHREFPVDGDLPWDHVDIGVRKSFLADELEKALAARTTSICSGKDCHGCGSFVKECLAGNVSPGRDFPDRPERESLPARTPEPTHAYRIAFAKTGWTRFISHLDLARTLRFAFRRARVELAHSEGFHPMPRMTFGPALPLGLEAHRELLDVITRAPIDPSELLDRLNAQLPTGLRFIDARRLGPGDAKLSRVTNAARYSITFESAEPGALDLAAAVERLLAREEIPVTRKRKGRERRVDLRPGVLALDVVDETRLRATLRIVGDGNVRPDEIVRELLGAHAPPVRFVRECLLTESDGTVQEITGGWSAPAA